MNDLNEVLIEGRLVRDPNGRGLESGAIVCTFTIASNAYYYDKVNSQRKERVTYVCVEAWRNVAERCMKNLKKGDGVRVAGQIKQARWEQEQGVKMERTFILAEHVEFKPKQTHTAEPVEPTPEPVKATDEGPNEVEQKEIDEKLIIDEPILDDFGEVGPDEEELVVFDEIKK